MQAVREVTHWSVPYRQPNHDYLLDGDRVIAYRKWGEGPVIKCSGNLKLNRRGRKFVSLTPNPFIDFDTPVKSKLIEIAGSKGGTYFVDPDARTCTCPGFTFRSTCKHTKELA